MFRLIGLFALFPITITLTISFFVLFTREKTTSKRLQSFAGVVAVLLWLCAALALIGGLVVLSTGRTPCMMHGRGMMAPCPGMMTPPPPAAMPAAPEK
jgi:succinate-acetate transporter protein